MNLKNANILWLSLLCSPALFAETNIQIDVGADKQEIDSFGASDAWSIDPLIKKWEFNNNQADIERVADLLFSTDKGIGLSAWRFNIGAGSVEQGEASNIPDAYRRAELLKTENGVFDTAKQSGQIRMLKEARERDVQELLAFVNSPPTWATDNSLSHPGNGIGVGSTNLRTDKLQQYTDYIAEVINYLRTDVGVPIKYISPVNEPSWEWEGQTQEANRYNNWDLKATYRSMQQSLIDAGLDSLVHIDGPEVVEYAAALSDDNMRAFNGLTYTGGMNSRGHGKYRNYIQEFLGDPEMRDILHNRLSVHGYFSDAQSRRMGRLRDLVANEVTEVSSGAKVWMSEMSILGIGADVRHFNGHGYDVTDMNYALHIAKIIHRDLTRLNASAWHWWLGVTPYDYKDGLLKIDSELDPSTLQTSKMFWTVGQFSRFIRPGYVRVALPDIDNLNGLMASAYRSADSKQIVVVLVNAGSQNQDINLALNNVPQGSAFDTFELYVTNNSHNLANTGQVTLNNTINVPAQSVVTLVSTIAQQQLAPEATFTHTGSTILAGDSISFESTSLNNPTTYLWEFEGGSPATSTAKNPTVTYPNVGSYDVTLTESNDNGSNTTTIVDAVSATDTQKVTCEGTGTIHRNQWSSLNDSSSVNDIPTYLAPDIEDSLNSFEIPSDAGDMYGSQIVGYICAPYTGQYRFWIASDNGSELWLSHNEDPSNKIRIASVLGRTDSRDWSKLTSQKSPIINLIAGNKYYIEAVHKEGYGSDNLAVRWKTPYTDTNLPIEGTYLLPYLGDENDLPSAAYTIKLAQGSLVLDVEGESIKDEGNISLWQPNNAENQQWNLLKLADGSYEIKNVNSGKCLDIAGASTETSANALQWTCSKSENQAFDLIFQSNTEFYVQAKHSGKYIGTNSTLNNVVQADQPTLWQFTMLE